jgi:two-component system NtrC family response regulator
LRRTTYREVRGISDDALAAIGRYHWPGNVRELENRMKRAIIMAEGKLITAGDLALESLPAEPESVDLRVEVEKLERSLAQKALIMSDGNISKAAKLLGISRPHLYNLMKSIDPKLSQDEPGE